MKKNDLEEYFNDIIELNPSFAVNIGLKSSKYFSHIEDTESEEYRCKFKRILNKFKDTNDISLNYIVKNNLDLLKYPFHMMPIYSFENPIIEFDYLNKTIYPKNKKFLKSRIIDFNKIIKTYILRMSEGVKNNITIPKIICKRLIKDLSVPKFKNRYHKFIYFLKNNYLKYCRKTIGLCGLKNGKEMYKILIKNYCKYDVSPEYIHQYGKKEVNRLSNLLKNNKVKESYCKSKKELIELYKHHYDNINNNIIPTNFNYKLKTKCNIKPVEKYMENSMAHAYYNEKLKTFYVNTKYIENHAIKDTFTLTMHETIPGHHYQFYYMIDKKLPLYKIYTIDNIAFIEGWALYAETLGPQDVGALTAQMFRAVRLVVDTGIHYYGWSFKKAYNYIKKYVSYSDKEIVSELYRYICIPGQALCYYLGKKYILKLRHLYITKYKIGNIKDFHDFILEDGIVTFDYLSNKLDNIHKKNNI